ncbi:hypothetical protein G6F51_014713 [Rhizopus arrhizus]|uniref:Uncharacterized protein n=1 Tax=Rhizopus oryzae TaxID=64495 RepID=A0A9P6XLZ5_RHIOR|nr:hypothetical protein G6F51_014713 [Rhizopus arrhizus]
MTIVVKLAAHAIHLGQDHARMMRQRPARRRGFNAAMFPQQQGHPQGVFHAADAFAGGSQRHVRTLGARRDGAGFLHVQEKPKVGQVESHPASVARVPQARP